MRMAPCLCAPQPPSSCVMLSLDHALTIICQAATPLGTETVLLAHAAGRRLAAPVIAAINAPRADVATMDGYAMRAADLADDAPLTIIGEARPGHPHPGAVLSRQAVRLFTGAPVPAGTDKVVMQERATASGDQVRFCGAAADPVFIRRAGSDFAAGHQVLAAGIILTPGALIAAAAADADQVTIWRRPRIAVLATGDELVAPGSAHSEAHAIPDSLTPGLTAAIAGWGGQIIDTALLPDHLPTLRAAAARALAEADVIVVSGGASVGAHDHARAMFGDRLAPLIDKVAVKPGKPVWLARANDAGAVDSGPLILGLPGNPGSAFVTARLFLAPLLAGCGGGDPLSVLAWQDVPLGATLPPAGDRDLMVRARLSEGEIVPVDNQDSGAQAALALATHLIWHRAGSAALPRAALVKSLSL